MLHRIFNLQFAVLAFTLILLAVPASAGGWGYSTIGNYGSYVVAYSVTYVDDSEYGGEPYVEGYLYQDGGEIDEGFAFGEYEAEVELYAGIPSGDQSSMFEVYGEHYDYDLEYNWPVYLGESYGYAYAGGSPPYISSLDPAYAFRGSSGTITINGSGLWPMGGTSVYLDNTWLQIDSGVDGQLDVEFSNLADGDHTLTVYTELGSDSATFTGADPTPVISSINPSTWYAGTSRTVIISGTGFGTNPSVGIGASGVSFSIQGAYDTEVDLLLSVDPSAPDQANVAVTVTSSGYGGGQFFYEPQQQQSNQGQGNANVAGATQSPLRLYRNWNGTSGTDVTNQTTTVVIGENVKLTAVLSGSQIDGGSWSFSIPVGIAFAHWAPDSQSSGTPDLVNVSTGRIPLMHFNVHTNAGAPNRVRYDVTTSGTEYIAQAFFNVVAPVITATASGLGAPGVAVDSYSYLMGSPIALHYGGPGNEGISSALNVADSLGYQGSIQWVQVVESLSNLQLSQGSVQSQRVCSQPVYDIPLSGGYPTKDDSFTDTDSPAQALQYLDEYRIDDAFTTWIMFKPSADPAGNQLPDAESIPILKISWNWHGRATGGLPPVPWQNDPEYALAYPGTQNSGGTASFQSAISFPYWPANANSCTWGAP